jgi:hypothetical protein
MVHNLGRIVCMQTYLREAVARSRQFLSRSTVPWEGHVLRRVAILGGSRGTVTANARASRRPRPTTTRQQHHDRHQKNDGTVNSARSRQREPAAPGNGSHRHITITARTGAASRHRAITTRRRQAARKRRASVEPSYHVHHVIERVPSHRAIRLRCRRRYVQRAQSFRDEHAAIAIP